LLWIINNECIWGDKLFNVFLRFTEENIEIRLTFIKVR